MIPVIDGHNDTLTTLYHEARSFFEDQQAGQVDLPRAQRGGLAGAFFAIFTPPPPDSPERDPMYGLTFTDDGYDVAERSPLDQTYAAAFTGTLLDYAAQLVEDSQGQVRIVVDTDGLEQCLADGTLACLLHLEGAEAVKPDLSNLEALYGRGVRAIGLTWSRPNAFGYGVPFRFPCQPDTGPGLTAAGKSLVEACNHLGILIDLAHLNEKGFYDVAALSTAPLVVTHADCYAICPSTRNLTDGQIDAVGRSGGVIGVNFEAMNTHPASSVEQDVPLTQITAHIDYIVQRIGIEHVAFGSDFDGAEMPYGIDDVSKLPNLIRTLEAAGCSAEDIDRIAYKNWLRVLKETWG